MDCEKIGLTIKTLRKEKGMTQLQLAEMLNVSDKAVSKWERGVGCPDISLLSELASLLGAELESLLNGEIRSRGTVAGNMKKLKFYACPLCGNILTAEGEAAIYCCGKKLMPLTAQKDKGQLTMERIENDWFVAGSHPVEKDHYIAFVGILTGDGLVMKRLYPEWDIQARLSWCAHGRLIWYCVQHGLFYRDF